MSIIVPTNNYSPRIKILSSYPRTIETITLNETVIDIDLHNTDVNTFRLELCGNALYIRQPLDPHVSTLVGTLYDVDRLTARNENGHIIIRIPRYPDGKTKPPRIIPIL